MAEVNDPVLITRVIKRWILLIIVVIILKNGNLRMVIVVVILKHGNSNTLEVDPCPGTRKWEPRSSLRP